MFSHETLFGKREGSFGFGIRVCRKPFRPVFLKQCSLKGGTQALRNIRKNYDVYVAVCGLSPLLFRRRLQKILLFGIIEKFKKHRFERFF